MSHARTARSKKVKASGDKLLALIDEIMRPDRRTQTTDRRIASHRRRMMKK